MCVQSVRPVVNLTAMPGSLNTSLFEPFLDFSVTVDRQLLIYGNIAQATPNAYFHYPLIQRLFYHVADELLLL